MGRDASGGVAGPELLAEHLVIGKSLGNHRAETALDLDINLGDQIDDALLVDSELAPEVRHLHFAGTHDRLDGRRQQERLRNVSHRTRAF